MNTTIDLNGAACRFMTEGRIPDGWTRFCCLSKSLKVNSQIQQYYWLENAEQWPELLSYWNLVNPTCEHTDLPIVAQHRTEPRHHQFMTLLSILPVLGEQHARTR